MRRSADAVRLWMWLEMEHGQVWDGGEQLRAQCCSAAPPSASPHIPWALGSPQGPDVALPTSVTLCSHLGIVCARRTLPLALPSVAPPHHKWTFAPPTRMTPRPCGHPKVSPVVPPSHHDTRMLLTASWLHHDTRMTAWPYGHPKMSQIALPHPRYLRWLSQMALLPPKILHWSPQDGQHSTFIAPDTSSSSLVTSRCPNGSYTPQNTTRSPLVIPK